MKKEQKGSSVKALPGYPYRRKLLTKEEVDGYFAGENIQCLICGRWFQLISYRHLGFGHGVTPDEYRERFGLPWTRGLTGKTVQKTLSKLAKKNVKDGKTTLTAKGTRLGTDAPKKPNQPFLKDLSARHALARYGQTRKFGEEDFETILERMRKQKRTLNEVCLDPDLPSLDSSRNYIKKHPEFKEKVREILFTFPYSKQCRLKDVSPRFNVDCERLHAKGMNQEKIAKALGVSTMPVRRVFREAKKRRGRTGSLIGARASKWRRKDFESILERMRNQKRALVDVCGDPDLPPKNTWNYYAKKHPGLVEKERRIHYTLPYSVQLKCRDVTPRFRRDCEHLRAAVMTIEKIAGALGVSVGAVMRVLRNRDGIIMGIEAAMFKVRGIPPGSSGCVVPDTTVRYEREDFVAVLDRMRAQKRSALEVCDESDLPSKASWRHFTKLHPEFAEEAHQIHYTYSYPKQHRINDVSPRFPFDCERLRKSGMTMGGIAKSLGVSISSAQKALGHMTAKKPPLRKPEEFQEILDRMREQRRTLLDVCKDPDLPGKTVCRRFAKKNPEFKEEASRIHHGLPYAVQLKIQDVSSRFRIDCERMYAEGMNMQQIATTLKVSKTAVRRSLLGIKKKKA